MAATGHFRPDYPAPGTARRPSWRRLLSPGLSWLDLLRPCSYRMRMGELHLPGQDVYVLNEPALVRQVLADAQGACPRHPAVARAMAPLVGDGLFTAAGDEAALRRVPWERALGEAGPRAGAAAREAARRLVARLRADDGRHGGTRDVEPLVREAVADAMLRLAFGRTMDDPLAPRLMAGVDAFGARLARQAGPSPLSRLAGRWHALRARAAARQVHAVLRAWAATPPRETVPPGEPLMATWQRRAVEAGAAASPPAQRHEAAMLLLAGHEPMASVLAWSLHLLAHSPRVQQRLHAQAMLGEGQGPGDLASHVVREALRLYPPLGFLPRTCTVPLTLRGKMIEPGDTLVVSPWLIHRHRGWWDRPDEFDPDRYAHAMDRPPSSQSLRDAWLPFGLGPRACPGAGVATRMLEILLGEVAREIELSPADGVPPRPEGRWTVRPAAGVRLHVAPRRPAG